MKNIIYEIEKINAKTLRRAFTLHILDVNLDLPEHEVVWLGVSVAQCQDPLQTRLLEGVEDAEEPLVELGEEGGVVGQPRLAALQILEEGKIVSADIFPGLLFVKNLLEYSCIDTDREMI